jgi:2,5-diamino-6-(ribosylamino)-4(3H)-pyrimidinone 5'-phosphate reductase
MVELGRILPQPLSGLERGVIVRGNSTGGIGGAASSVIQRFFDKTRPTTPAGPVAREDIYRELAFPHGIDTPSRRPYTAINMVATVDGKVVIGGPGTTRLIGTATDHFLMARIESQADAVLFGANLAREDDPGYPLLSDERRRRRAAAGLRPDPLWAVVTRRGEFSGRPRVFQAGRDKTALFTSALIDPARRAQLEEWTQVFICGEDRVDPLELGRVLREELAVNRMISLGGPILNATLIEAGAADELFMTLAPKLQGGSRLPTLVEGLGYQPEHLPQLELLSVYADGSELYLRYRLPSELAGPSAMVDLTTTGA